MIAVDDFRNAVAAVDTLLNLAEVVASEDLLVDTLLDTRLALGTEGTDDFVASADSEDCLARVVCSVVSA